MQLLSCYFQKIQIRKKKQEYTITEQPLGCLPYQWIHTGKCHTLSAIRVLQSIKPTTTQTPSSGLTVASQPWPPKPLLLDTKQFPFGETSQWVWMYCLAGKVLVTCHARLSHTLQTGTQTNIHSNKQDTYSIYSIIHSCCNTG